jgi:predicted ATPase
VSERRLFLSYRREDAAGHAGRLADHLLDRFGQGSVFMDVESIEAGINFAEAIERAINEADAVLVVIGPGWLDAASSSGSRRLDEPEDFVRREIEAALASDVRVIPVLVGGVSMPGEDRLPPTLAELARRNAVELLDRRWREDVDVLVDVVEGRERSLLGNLPAQPTPFLGRERELAELIELLRRDDTRLLTLTGPGGIGKTRLAIQAASKLAHTYPGGAWLVGLASVTDPDLVIVEVARVIEAREAADGAVVDAIAARLSRGRTLIVLDNVEQLLPDAAAPIAQLSAAAASLELIVTTRQRLHVTAEREFALATLGEDAAVELFVDRARASRGDFALSDQAQRDTVAALCARLDGLPLAIELAASRVRLLPPQALLTRLGRRLELLRGGARDRPERQQTLRATLDWSFDLLDAEERRLFARLSVFSGGFRLDAAEAVCGCDIDGVETLLENSLLRSEEQADGEPRFFMLESIRDYAFERLERDQEADELQERHARWYAAWLEARAEERLTGKLLFSWGPEDEEHDNIRAALGWARDRGDIELELQFAASAGLFYWPNRGHLSEGRRWLDDVLTRSHDADQRQRARALVAGAQHAWRQGDHERSDELAAEAQSILERVDDPGTLAMALVARGIAADFRGDGQAEASYYEVAEKIYRELGHTAALEAILSNRGYADIVAGDFESAERRLREVADSSRGPVRLHATANHGLALARLGRLEEAEARYGEALGGAMTTDPSTEVVLYGFEGLALVAAARTDDLRAARLWGVSTAICDATGYVLATAERSFHDELVEQVRGRLGDADFDRALDEGRRLPVDAAIALALGGR